MTAWFRGRTIYIVALLWALTLALAVSLDTVTRGTMIAAMIPRIVTTANSSISEKPLRLRFMYVFMLFPQSRHALRAIRSTGRSFLVKPWSFGGLYVQT